MNEFIVKHEKQVIGTLSGLDRIRFRGTFRVLAVAKMLMVWLTQQKVLIKDFRDFAESLTQRLKRAVEQVAQQRVRDIEFLRSSRYSKEDLVRELIRREGLTEGVVCVLSAVEPCRSYEVRRNPETKTLDLEAQSRKCLHWYVYFLDAVLGLCHVRIQSWLPFTVHVCVNGREMLCRELTRQGIGFERRDNCLARVDDVAAAQKILDSQPWDAWSTRLDELVHRAVVSQAANTRYLTAIAAVDSPTPLGRVVDQLAKPVLTKKCRARGLHPLTGRDSQVTRLLRLFRAHGLIQKLPRTHHYQLTANDRRLLPTFPNARAASTQSLTKIAA